MELKLDEKEIQRLINEKIRTEVVKALSKSPGELVEAVVKVALTKKESGWSSETVFQKAINKMIEDTAKEIFQGWLNENSELIKKEIEKQLKTTPSKLAKTIAEQVIEGLGKSFYVYAKLKLENED